MRIGLGFLYGLLKKKYFVLVWGLWMVGVRYLQLLLRVELCFPQGLL